MNYSSFLRVLFAAILVLGFSSAAFAQATRTWVSGVGDDVNPCSRTAPCKTLAGAISKTAAGGEINAIDPGGFGAVTIIKSMTIDLYSTEGGVLAGGNGVVVNMPAATDVTVLRGLDIFGVNPPTNGVRFINQGTLHVQHCRIKRFNAANSNGISFAPSAAGSELYVSDTQISENGNATTGAGIQIQPTGAGTAKVALNRVQVNNNIVGIRAQSAAVANTINVSIVDSETSGNQFHGIVALSTGALVQIMVDGATSSQNADQGIRADGTNAKIRMGNSNITGNGLGTSASGGATIESYGNNRINGNTADGPNPPDIPQQ